jgi:signal transduction histidine kinase
VDRRRFLLTSVAGALAAPLGDARAGHVAPQMVSEADKRDMWYSLAREFRDVMDIVQGYSDLLLRDTSLIDTQRRYVEAVLLQADRGYEAIGYLHALAGHYTPSGGSEPAEHGHGT